MTSLPYRYRVTQHSTDPRKAPIVPLSQGPRLSGAGYPTPPSDHLDTRGLLLFFALAADVSVTVVALTAAGILSITGCIIVAFGAAR